MCTFVPECQILSASEDMLVYINIYKQPGAVIVLCMVPCSIRGFDCLEYELSAGLLTEDWQ